MRKSRLTLLMLSFLTGMWGGMAIQSDAMDVFCNPVRNVTRRGGCSYSSTFLTGNPSMLVPHSLRYKYDEHSGDIVEARLESKEVREIFEFLENNNKVRFLNLMNPNMGVNSVVNLDFLNKFPNLKGLRLYKSEFCNPEQTIDLSNLKFLREFCDDTGNFYPSNIVYSSSLESVRTYPNKIDQLPWGITELKLTRPRGAIIFDSYPMTFDLNKLKRFQVLRNLDIGDFDFRRGDFEILRNLSSLTSLALKRVTEDDLKYLKGIEFLETLKVRFYEAGYLSALSCLPLKNFETIIAKKLFELYGPKKMPHLESFSLGNAEYLTNLNHFRDWSPNLKKLSLYYDYLDAYSSVSLSGLEGLPIEDLEIIYSEVKDFDALRTLRHLKYLNLGKSYPVRWEGLRDHPSLERLQISAIALHFTTEYCYLHNIHPNPLDVLKTISSLKLINTWREERVYGLPAFRAARPDVIIGDYRDWKNAILPTILPKE